MRLRVRDVGWVVLGVGIWGLLKWLGVVLTIFAVSATGCEPLISIKSRTGGHRTNLPPRKPWHEYLEAMEREGRFKGHDR